MHYVGYSHEEDEWRDESEIIIKEVCCTIPYPPTFALYREFSLPLVKLEMMFDKIMFDGGLRVAGKLKEHRRGIEHYSVSNYSDLDDLLGKNWHIRGLNKAGDHAYAILDSIDFYI